VGDSWPLEKTGFDRQSLARNWQWAPGVEEIYTRPEDYDLEHEGDDEDIAFYLDLVRRLRPARVLELASGSGRVTVPLARLAPELGYHVVGLEIADTMLAEAERKRADLEPEVRRRVEFVKGDIRTWAAREPFDLVITPCSSLSHLLGLDDQLAAWRRTHDNLVPGGRFVADLTMPNLAAYAESMQTPPRTMLEIDVDTSDPKTGARLLRYKTTRYLPHEQRAEIRFVYDKFPEGEQVDRYVSDFDCHVYYPRELELLFLSSGFEIEARYGSYAFKALRRSSRQIIMVGRRR
jgi:SAM-dependent methyltransferase